MERLRFIILFVMIGFTGCKQTVNQRDDVIFVDVNASYPKKELILQDFMDVEYIPLETNDDFLCQGEVMAIGKDIILVKNNKNDGNIFVFDRNGKALRIINRKGQSGKDYVYLSEVMLDEDNNEIFVNDGNSKKILVYDLDGEFKRSFYYTENFRYADIYNLDQENLILKDDTYYLGRSKNKPMHMIVSKSDGSVTKEIQIEYEEKISIDVQYDFNGKIGAARAPGFFAIVPYRNKFFIVEPSSDTIYTLLPDYSISPFIVRTPSIQSMDPEKFLFLNMLTDRYYFMSTVKKTLDFPNVNLMYDKQENAIFEYTVYNDDYSNKRSVFMKLKPMNNEIAIWQKIESHQLMEANERGELKGKLKEIANTLDEDSNPVIMLIKYLASPSR